MSEGVNQDAVQCAKNRLRAGLAEGRGQKRSGLERSVLRVWKIKQSKLGAGLFAKPALQERSHRLRRRGPEFHGDIVLGESPGGEVCAGVGRANGNK